MKEIKKSGVERVGFTAPSTSFYWTVRLYSFSRILFFFPPLKCYNIEMHIYEALLM
jgi:hypothetical protein